VAWRAEAWVFLGPDPGPALPIPLHSEFDLQVVGTNNVNMDTTEQELEQAFLTLPTLNHAGMALLQYLRGISGAKAYKNAGGVFNFGFVSFSFPKGEERIRMHVDVEMEGIDAMDMRWLPLHADEAFPVCEIKRAGQLGQAVKYIRLAYDKCLATRQIPSQSPYLN
jgi:hypothetical protein